MKIVKLVALSVIIVPLTLTASDYSNLDISSIARKYLSSPNTGFNNAETKQEVLGQEIVGKDLQEKNEYSSTATLNSLLNATPDSIKSALVEKIPQEYKGYLVQFIEFIKSFFSNDKDKVTTLDSIKNLLQKNREAYDAHNTEQLPAQ